MLWNFRLFSILIFRLCSLVIFGSQRISLFLFRIRIHTSYTVAALVKSITCIPHIECEHSCEMFAKNFVRLFHFSLQFFGFVFHCCSKNCFTTTHGPHTQAITFLCYKMCKHGCLIDFISGILNGLYSVFFFLSTFSEFFNSCDTRMI